MTDAPTPTGWGRPPFSTTRIGPSPDPARRNEDAVRVRPGLAVVVDGAGTPKRYRLGCDHTVAWYSHHLADVMVESYADRSADQRDALASAIARVRALHPECSLEGGSPSATIACFRTNGATMEYLVQCDAAILLQQADGSASMVTDDHIDHVDRTRAEELRNHPDGFWLPQGDPAVARHAVVGEVPLDRLRGVVACSDGITRALDRLGLHAVSGLVDSCLTDAENLIDEIRRAEADGTPRPGKVHDDATLALLTERTRVPSPGTNFHHCL